MPQQFAAIAAELGADFSHAETLSGGSISSACALYFRDRAPVFAKLNCTVPGDFFAAEAAGLRALAQGGPLRVPAVLLCSSELIVLELISSAAPSASYWQALAEGLAEMHSRPVRCFGFDSDNYCGSTPQPNTKVDSGYTFFAAQRLRYQAKLAFDSGKLLKDDMAALDKLSLRLPELIPEQPPSLIHGDLWSGNVISDANGEPVLIDPAAHWGWAEADIAMTMLFGGFASQFYSAYQQARPMFAGWRDRVPLYNLYHLLNHLNLFGSSYYHDVSKILRGFS